MKIEFSPLALTQNPFIHTGLSPGAKAGGVCRKPFQRFSFSISIETVKTVS
jgi:hypothetical protein